MIPSDDHVRPPERIQPTLDLIGEIWKRYPDLRLGQLLVNALRPSSPVPEIFRAEDDRLPEGLKELAGAMQQARDEPDA